MQASHVSTRCRVCIRLKGFCHVFFFVTTQHYDFIIAIIILSKGKKIINVICDYASFSYYLHYFLFSFFFRLFISYGVRPGHFGKCTPAPFWRRDLYFSLVTQFHTEKANTVTSGFQANRMTLMMRGFLVQSSAGVAVVSILYPVFCYQMIYTDIYRATEPDGCVQYH